MKAGISSDADLELLGKLLRLFTDKVDLNATVQVSHADALGALE
ncbi:hypothetical protein ACN469_17800 [Corallococcus terminator]